MFDKECNLVPINAFKHHWTQEIFSYMEKPRPDYGIMLVLNGQIDFVSPQSDVVCAKAGNIVFLPKNSYYEARFRIELGEIDNYLINFDSDKDYLYPKPKMILENASVSCVDMFKEFVGENYNAEDMNFRARGLFYLLIDAVLSEKEGAKSTKNKVLEKAKGLLQNESDISISQIAKECSVSESGLRKIFVQQTGMPPTQHRLTEKFNKAKYMLESTDMSVGEIADKLNFYDAAYFCKLFRKQTHVSPKQYRQNKKL